MATKTKIKPETFASKLKAARQRRGLTQDELAHSLGVTVVSVSHWETGYSTPQDRGRVLKVVKRLVPTRHLIGQLSRTERLALVTQYEELTAMLEGLGELDERAKTEAAIASEVVKRLGLKLAGDSDPVTWTNIRRHVDTAARLLDGVLTARLDRIKNGNAGMILED